MLGGGVETGAITQFYGEPASVKSILCYTTCVILPNDNKVIYIDTEGKFRPYSIELIAKGRALNPYEVLQKIQVAKPQNSHELEKCIENACTNIKSDLRIRLVIVDSIINLYKVDYPERSRLPQRQQQLNKYVHMLSNIAQSNNVAIIVTNHLVLTDFLPSGANHYYLQLEISFLMSQHTEFVSCACFLIG